MTPSPPALLALPLAGGVSVLAWRAGMLSGTGAIAAAAVGAAVLVAAGWSGAAVLLAFFLPSSAVGRLALRHPAATDARGERRDAVQVLANGGAAALSGFAEWWAPGLGLWMVTASLAAAGADTWSTSVGALSSSEPRHLLSGRRVPRGTSGGVSTVGSFGAVAGAVAVAGTGGLFGGGVALALAGSAIGFGGMLLDSLLGASVQGRFKCPECRQESERRRHRCGVRTRRIGGWQWLDNDGVNALTTGTAAGFGALAWCWLSPS